ncbi:MAG: YceI family protein [Pirellulaceae bacterium]|jgi:polyisoprenoid-binding protein YceI|nr:YceI family protein [Pirellulaceae bacterium]
MRCAFSLACLLLASLLLATALVGCSQKSGGQGVAAVDEPQYDSSGNQVGQINSKPDTPQHVAVAIYDDVAVFSGDNASILFAFSVLDGEDHVGGFQDFTGRIEVDSKAKTIKSVTVEMTSGSLWTDTQPFANQLKSPEMFNAADYPTAKFESTSSVASAGNAAQFLLAGNLTLRGVTKEVSFEVNVTHISHLLEMKGECEIDPGQFGIGGEQASSDGSFTMTIDVGVVTKPVTSSNRQSGGGGKKGGGKKGGAKAAGGRQGGFDPLAMFARRDADEDGELTGEEIPERMQERLDSIDTDGNGAVSRKELEAFAPQEPEN